MLFEIADLLPQCISVNSVVAGVLQLELLKIIIDKPLSSLRQIDYCGDWESRPIMASELPKCSEVLVHHAALQ